MTVRADDDRGQEAGGAGVQRRFAVPAEEAGARLDAWLAARLGVGRTAVRALLERGAVRVDGRRAGRGHKGAALAAGACVVVEGFAPPAARRAPAEPERPLVVLASGPGWLAVDKPPGVPVHPLREGERGTLAGAVLARRPEMAGVGEGGLRSGVVHRLDVDTSGVVLFATEAAAWARLREAFRSHRVEKVYRALVVGRLEGEGALELDLAVARHRPARVRVVGVAAAPDAPLAPGARRTALRWRALAHGPDATLVEVRPRTGFLHQIRASLAWLGHPVCGDRTYGAPADPARAPRHLLHAHHLRFEEIAATSPIPPDLAAASGALTWTGEPSSEGPGPCAAA